MEKGGEEKAKQRRDHKITGWMETEGVTLLRQPHGQCKDGEVDLWKKRLVKPINVGKVHCTRGNQFSCGDGTERRD